MGSTSPRGLNVSGARDRSDARPRTGRSPASGANVSARLIYRQRTGEADLSAEASGTAQKAWEATRIVLYALPADFKRVNLELRGNVWGSPQPLNAGGFDWLRCSSLQPILSRSGRRSSRVKMSTIPVTPMVGWPPGLRNLPATFAVISPVTRDWLVPWICMIFVCKSECARTKRLNTSLGRPSLRSIDLRMGCDVLSRLGCRRTKGAMEGNHLVAQEGESASEHVTCSTCRSSLIFSRSTNSTGMTLLPIADSFGSRRAERPAFLAAFHRPINGFGTVVANHAELQDQIDSACSRDVCDDGSCHKVHQARRQANFGDECDIGSFGLSADTSDSLHDRYACRDRYERYAMIDACPCDSRCAGFGVQHDQ